MKESNEEYKHAEAFCLMKYKCEKCGQAEVVWNSRDGVTPFIINCEKCGGNMQHIDWHSDVRQVGYIPKLGQRVFIDMPSDVFKIYCRVKAKYIKDNVEGNTEKLQKIYSKLLREYDKNEPYLMKIGSR